MKLNLIIPFAILIPVFAYAGEEDTTAVHEMFSSKSIDSTYTIESKVDNSLAKEESAETEAAPVLSYDLISFEENHIPVTEEIFKKHISSSEFTVSMDYNHLVKRQIDYFGTRWQGKLKEMVSKSQYFFPLYEEILLEYDMPLEIKYLSVIESGLNPYAWSRVGAAGVWQFMPATGRIFDLSISSQLDERKSVEKSTRAACSYLKQ
ncbi:MAG: lytic transglycosylase domain-containing protein, partial [Bacteroidia bacterium]